MKKILLFFALVAVTTSAIIVSSCKKSSNSNPLTGSWELNSEHDVTTYVSPAQTITEDTSYAHGHSEIVQFKSNNTYTITDYSVTPSAVVDQGTYMTANSRLIITSANSTSGADTSSYSISGSKLVVISTDNSPGFYSDTQTITFTRQ